MSEKVQEVIDEIIGDTLKTYRKYFPSPIPPGMEFDDDSFIRSFYKKLIDPVRREVFSKTVLYKTLEGTFHKIKIQPWSYNNFQGLQQIGENSINENNFRASWKVLKDELNIGIDNKFRHPRVGDQIIEADGTINVVEPFMGQPHFSFSATNAAKTTLIIHSRVQKPLSVT